MGYLPYQGTLIHESDWNVLVILDAMRYDYFEKYNTLSGHLTKVTSRASCTINWFIRTFPDKYPYVYVSANPNCTKKEKKNIFHGGGHFQKVVEVWNIGWNEKWKTVLPKTMTAISIPHLNEEKVILHYMQPHGPYFLHIEGEQPGWIVNNYHITLVGENIYRDIDIETFKKGYKANVELILKEMECLFPHIPSHQKIIITSDHGQMLGEDRMRAHPCNTIHPLLYNVPWFEVIR